MIYITIVSLLVGIIWNSMLFATFCEHEDGERFKYVSGLVIALMAAGLFTLMVTL